MFTPSNEMILAANDVLIAMAHEQFLRPVVESIQKAVLEESAFYVSDEFRLLRGGEDGLVSNENRLNNKITDISRSYLMPESDFEKYNDLCDQKYKQAGLVFEEGKCPLLVAESQLRDAKIALVDSLQSVSGIGSEKLLRAGVEPFNHAVDLSLKLLTPFVADGCKHLNGNKRLKAKP